MSDIHPGILFTGSCIGLLATAVGFAVTGDIMGALKAQFLLSNSQAGWIMGAWLQGFVISILVFGPLVDALGMRLQLRMACFGHLLGALVFMSATFFRETPATAFWVLMLGTLILAMANGLIEAVCNPLVTTIYPERKTEKLNQFHVWFPGGIFIGGLACYFMNVLADKTGVAWISAWQLKMCLIIVPTIVYGVLFTGQRFPFTERVQSGLSFGEMVSSTLLRPLFIILALCMCITASLELGPGRWIPSVYGAVGISGILMLAWQNGLMAVMRYFAGHAIERLRPSGMLVVSAIIGGIGLYLLSFASTKGMAFAAVTVFAIGVCYFWPTMLGFTSERVPKGGALALALMGGFGNLAVGFLTTPAMGNIADRYIEANLPVQQAQATLQRVVDVYPAPPAEKKPTQYSDTEKAHADAAAALAGLTSGQPEGKAVLAAAAALRSAADAVPVGFNEEQMAQIKSVEDEARSIVGPADNQGGRRSFRYLAPFALILVAVFGTIYLRDRARGGYRVERIGDAAEPPVTPK
jgi:fucose permease